MADTGSDEALQKYSEVLERLNSALYQRELHVEREQLAKQLGIAEEIEQARQVKSQYLALSTDEWLAWINDRKSSLPQLPADDVTPYLDVIELYRRGSKEYLSIPFLVNWSEWVISQYYAAQGLAPPPTSAGGGEDEDTAMQPAERKVGEPDQLLGVVFSLEEVRDIREEVLAVGGTHLTESSGLWKLWKDFEMDLLKKPALSDADDPPILRPDQLLVVEQLYLARLKVPHLDIAETFSSYSTFVSTFDNDNYDKSLPAANKIYSGNAKKADERYPEEEKLKAAGFSVQAYLDYISWEREVKRPDTPLVKQLFERAIRDSPEDAELWDAYLEFLHKVPAKEAHLRDSTERAIRNVPSSVAIWTATLRIVEKLGLGSEEIEGVFQRAMNGGLLGTDMDAVVNLYHARASYYRRQSDVNASEDGPDGGLVGMALGVLQEGVEATKKIHKKGDLQSRLEKYLIKLYERYNMIDEARTDWAELTKAQPHSYAIWYGRADFETRQGDYAKAHEVYSQGCSARGVDYPEYLLDAWVSFETEYGNLADVEFSLVKSKRQRKNLERRRAREAADAARKAASTYTTATDADAFITAATEPEAETNDKKRERSPQDEAASASTAKKVRIAEPAPAAPPPAPAKTAEEPRRDREHSTVFAVSDGSMSEEQVRQLFSDCGPVREMQLKEIENRTYAQIEFKDKESVLAARTKDKKRINDVELEVYIAWECCLYVTNYPESYDKDAVQKLFEQYGAIFDIRWPSKRYKATRRFCYVQFANPAHAQAALELHGRELEPGHALVAQISDPSRKKSRSDADANKRELYVANIARSAKEPDLRKLFETYGTLKEIRVPTDDEGSCKGFAFVEFEDEAAAQAALALNNHELKKRHISVTIAEKRAAGTARAGHIERRPEVEDLGVRVRGLKIETQEALIQQAFEKIAPVRRVNYIAGTTEAVVLFENAADVGKVLMQRDDIKVDGQAVGITGEAARKAAATGDGPSASLMPRQAGRGRGRIGLAGARGGRGGRGRGGLGFGGSTRPASTVTSSQGDTGAVKMETAEVNSAEKSQDEFRKMLSK
ncbi:hypothetical protein BMF94_1996 [Rhodotorula taiwanensis]|uniref:U4/U6 snRNA-associated-splicing factor PRP24 n=1 Tax=Rhodotorula taiwanensis TaxID=741276 RepID=A0A2S5BE22_9BASI|nr:hypothetical protein BMF94_1996 [Rhodotorula taiwanensis]